MTVVRVTAGRSGVSVDSATEVDLVNTSITGLSIAGCVRWVFNVEVADADINLRVYLGAGDNCGLIEFAALGGVVSAGTHHSIERDYNSFTKIRITAKTTSGTAVVSSDFKGF